jgi:hypothetical protein
MPDSKDKKRDMWIDDDDAWGEAEAPDGMKHLIGPCPKESDCERVYDAIVAHGLADVEPADRVFLG